MPGAIPTFVSLSKRLQNFFKRFPPSTASAWQTEGESRLNPFLPRKNPITGVWAEPQYSNRRQADLFKEARRFGLEHLLPSESRWNREQSQTKIIRGTRFWKLKKHEREHEKRQQEIEKALENMDARIQEIKLVCYSSQFFALCTSISKPLNFSRSILDRRIQIVHS